jgi:hypothetical protein
MSNDASLRRSVLEQLYIGAYPDISAVASSDPRLTLDDHDTLTRAVVRLLDHFPGPDDPDALAQWAISTIVQPGLELLATLNTLRGEYRAVVLRAIWSVLFRCDDLGVTYPDKGMGTVGEIEQEVWIRIFLDLDKWLTPAYSKRIGGKPAKLSTRLYEFARLQAMGWRTERLRKLAKFGDLADADYKGTQGAKKPGLSELDRRAA